MMSIPSATVPQDTAQPSRVHPTPRPLTHNQYGRHEAETVRKSSPMSQAGLFHGTRVSVMSSPELMCGGGERPSGVSAIDKNRSLKHLETMICRGVKTRRVRNFLLGLKFLLERWCWLSSCCARVRKEHRACNTVEWYTAFRIYGKIRFLWLRTLRDRARNVLVRFKVSLKIIYRALYGASSFVFSGF